jgi:glycosyltransferase involved in cell wall biosynthesis
MMMHQQNTILKILIIEDSLYGHHLNYLRLTSQILAGNGYDCTLLTSEKHRNAMEVHCQELEVSEIIFLPELKGLMAMIGKLRIGIIDQFVFWFRLKRNLASVLARTGAEHIWFSYFDGILHAWGTLGDPLPSSTTCSGLFIRQFSGLEQSGIPICGTAKGLKNFLFMKFLMSEKIKSVCTILEPVCKYLKQTNSTLNRKISYTPDPVRLPIKMSRSEALNRLSIKDARVIVMLYGMVCARKGVYELLDALKSEYWPEAACVVCAGPLDDDVRIAILQNYAGLIADGKLQVVDRFLRGVDEDAVFASTDMMWIGYKNFNGNSAVLLQSVACGIPVIAKKHGMIGAYMQEHPACGIVLESLEAIAICQAVKSHVQSALIVPKEEMNHALENYSEHVFQEGLLECIRKANS